MPLNDRYIISYVSVDIVLQLYFTTRTKYNFSDGQHRLHCEGQILWCTTAFSILLNHV